MKMLAIIGDSLKHMLKEPMIVESFFYSAYRVKTLRIKTSEHCIPKKCNKSFINTSIRPLALDK